MSEAILFPGQGAQFAGMGKDWCEAHPVAAETFREAGEALDLDLSDWVWNRGGFAGLENNRWYHIEQVAEMNTPGKNDGVLRAWVEPSSAGSRGRNSERRSWETWTPSSTL